MSVVVQERPSAPSADVPVRPQRQLRWALPTIFVALNAIAFLILQPPVNDLWAARARASAASDGVGLSYWFSWFGGSTPGNYSVFTPYVCSLIGTELLGALSAVAIAALATLLLRGARHPLAASALAAVCTAANLWSGRIPFLFGGAFAVAALIAVRKHHRIWTVALTLLSVLASPVTGAFIALGLSGTFLTTRTKQYRPIIAYAAVTALIGLVGIAVLFGAPGPEPFSLVFALEVLGGLALLYLIRPADHLRTTLWVSAIATVAIWAVPNGMGSNISRLVFFCLPVAVVATSSLRSRVIAFAAVPIAIAGSAGTVLDLVHAERPVSSARYYTSLITELDSLSGLGNCRVEVVDHGAHSGDAVLPAHAQLARGWQTQENTELNGVLEDPKLDPVQYKVWLDNHAVCYVALPAETVKSNPEYSLVAAGGIGYLHQVWKDPQWKLFRVTHPTLIVAPPAYVVAYSQVSLTVHIPCACVTTVRVRWSQYLTAALRPPKGTVSDGDPVLAKIAVDSAGWTRVTTQHKGTYVLSGNLTVGLP